MYHRTDIKKINKIQSKENKQRKKFHNSAMNYAKYFLINKVFTNGFRLI